VDQAPTEIKLEQANDTRDDPSFLARRLANAVPQNHVDEGIDDPPG
jgi:hypothetical protein